MDAIATSLRSLALVMNRLDPLLERWPNPEAVDQFLAREVGWALNHLTGRFDGESNPELSSAVSALRSKYSMNASLPSATVGLCWM